MKPAFNTIQDGKELIKKLSEKHEIILELENIKFSVQENIEVMNPDEISLLAVRLSTYLCNLGNLTAEFIAQANEYYIYRKFRYLWEFNAVAGTMTVKAAENEALDRSFKAHKDELIMKYVADYFKEFKQDMERLLGTLQSRLRTLQGERISEYMDMKHGAQ